MEATLFHREFSRIRTQFNAARSGYQSWATQMISEFYIQGTEANEGPDASKGQSSNLLWNGGSFGN
jgi:hypothetical protein